MSTPHSNPQPDLAAIALNELHAAGFRPEFSTQAATQLAEIQHHPLASSSAAPDLRDLPWSSIDNDTSRDLDQIEVATPTPAGIHLQVAIADVSALVPKDSPLDEHAAAQTQTVYTAVRNFPMLPVELSTDLTSLNENADRAAVILGFTVAPDGALIGEQVTTATVRNHAQLAYSRVGPWLDAAAHAATIPTANAAALRAPIADQTHSTGAVSSQPLAANTLAEQLHLQDQAAQALRAARQRAGALDFQRAEADPVMLDGRIAGLQETVQNRAMQLIEDLMVAANGVMARALRSGNRSSLQRVVRVPQRWDRIVALAAEHNTTLPSTPDPVALNQFLTAQRQAAPDLYPDLAVAVIKLLGAGEYVLLRPGDDPLGHFGLAARDYTHSTAPNRRFPDLVTQRCLHAMLAGAPAPYSDDELTAIATHCNEADKALRKIDRAMGKRVAAVALSSHIGQVYSAVVTGATPKGVYARVFTPPFEGRVLQNEAGLDVGARIRVKLLHTDPVRAFIDLARVS